MAARDVNLTDHLAACLEARMRNRHHLNANEVVHEALGGYEAALAAETQAVATIRTAAREAFASDALPARMPPATLAAMIGCLTQSGWASSKP